MPGETQRERYGWTGGGRHRESIEDAIAIEEGSRREHRRPGIVSGTTNKRK